jgi:aminoglycoside phosphotransferase (APT) family kinase protein
MPTPIAELIEELAGLHAPYADYEWQGWHIRPIASGNNLLFRATRDGHDWAVKFMIRDQRNRAQREFSALTLIDSLGTPVGPRPLHIDQDSYPQAVVVQTWVDGTALSSPPAEDATWAQILQTYALVHRIQLADALRHGVVAEQTIGVTPTDQTAAIRAFAREIPPTIHAEALANLIEALDQARLPNIRTSRCWCHGDPNIRNLLVTAGGVQLVDWEYSGIADPAQEIAGLMAHPFVRSASEERRRWVAEHYAVRSGEPDMLPRIQVHYALRLAWWCVRLVFGRYVLLRRPSHRLVGPLAEEEISTLDNIDDYLSRAHMGLATFT